MKKLTNFIIILLTIVFIGVSYINPVSASYTPIENDLIKTNNNSAIYYIDADGKRHLFVNSSTFWTWHEGSWADQKIKIISQDDFNSLPTGTNISARPGVNLIKFQNSPRVYAVSTNATINQIVSSDGNSSIAKLLYGNDYAKKIITIQNGFENDYQRGDVLTSKSLLPNGSLIKYQNSQDIFYIENNQKRKVTDNGFKLNNFKQSSIITVYNSNLANYNNGLIIDNKESFNKPQIANMPNTPISVSLCKVYTYGDKYWGGTHECIDKIWIKGVYFIAKDQTSGFQPDWSKNMLDIFGQVKNFYENQFENKINITIDDSPIVIYGEKSIGEYDSASIAQEVYKNISSSLPQSDYYVDIQTFVVDGANDVNGNNLYNGAIFLNGNNRIVESVNQYGWLESYSLGGVTKYGTDYSGYLGTAHEFGHSLLIPHPWEEDINKDSKGLIINPQFGNMEQGSLMSYGGQLGPLIPNSFIRSSVKNKMIVK